MRPVLFALLFILFVCPTTNAQERKEYDEAVRLANEANAQLTKGEIRIADSLINLSIAVYPTVQIFDYANTMASLPDMAGSNRIMTKAAQRLLTMKSPQVLMMVPGSGLITCDKKYAYFGFLLKSYELYKMIGEMKWIEGSLVQAVNVLFQPMSASDYYASMQHLLRIELLRLKKSYKEALAYINNLPPTALAAQSVYASMTAKAELQIPILCEMGDFGQAMANVRFLDVNPQLRAAQYSWMFYIATMMNDPRQAMSYYTMIPQPMVQANPNAYNYVLGLIDTKNSNYEEAIHKLLLAASDQSKKNVGAYWLIEKWKLYTALGDAYAGANQYQKAKDNYTIALLANPGYEEATKALFKLESLQATMKAADKSAPVITLFEPSPDRGLVVTTEDAKVMVKGIASDASGIREVQLNGTAVYTQSSGDFWGEVNVKDGMNQLTVTATDAAGNRKEQVFTIEKKAGKTDQENTKQGKNYALLIAAQNYADEQIPSLENPVADAVRLKLILKNDYNFSEQEIITLFNPEVNDVKRQLLELSNTIRPEDNLVIFYAGHGIWVEKEKKGYWLLTNSKRFEEASWLPNKDVLDLIAKLPARHTLLITDACFSGSVFKTRGLGDAPVAIQQMGEKISRIAITSGNDTEVPDKSVFMKYLVKALSENKEKYLTAQKMFVNQIIEAVMTETKTEPRYGTLEMAGHVGGDYIFVKKGSSLRSE